MATGGTPYGAGRKPRKRKHSGPVQPPFLTFDPAIEAQRGAAKRGLGDTLRDIKTDRHFGRNNLEQALRNIRTGTSRGRQNTITSYRRGTQRLVNQEQDARSSATRANQDFDTRLQDIGRQFAQLGHRQAEGANAAGVLDSAGEAASAAARRRNQTLSEKPIHTARARLGEDLATALRRIGGAQGELGQDRDRSLGRLLADRNRERRLSRKDFKRQKFVGKRKGQRARREAVIADADLLAQEIYQARQNRPGAFAKSGRRRGRRGRRRRR